MRSRTSVLGSRIPAKAWTSVVTAPSGTCDEPVHLAAGDVGHGGGGVVLAADVDERRVVVRVVAAVRGRVRDADADAAVPGREPDGAGVGAEVGVERAVLLHDHDNMLDLVDRGRDRGAPEVAVSGGRRLTAAGRAPAGAERDGHRHRRGESERDRDAGKRPPTARIHLAPVHAHPSGEVRGHAGCIGGSSQPFAKAMDPTPIRPVDCVVMLRCDRKRGRSSRHYKMVP
jgi:hypothetical protein